MCSMYHSFLFKAWTAVNLYMAFCLSVHMLMDFWPFLPFDSSEYSQRVRFSTRACIIVLLEVQRWLSFSSVPHPTLVHLMVVVHFLMLKIRKRRDSQLSIVVIAVVALILCGPPALGDSLVWFSSGWAFIAEILDVSSGIFKEINNECRWVACLLKMNLVFVF